MTPTLTLTKTLLFQTGACLILNLIKKNDKNLQISSPIKSLIWKKNLQLNAQQLFLKQQLTRFRYWKAWNSHTVLPLSASIRTHKETTLTFTKNKKASWSYSSDWTGRQAVHKYGVSNASNSFPRFISHWSHLRRALLIEDTNDSEQVRKICEYLHFSKNS